VWRRRSAAAPCHADQPTGTGGDPHVGPAHGHSRCRLRRCGGRPHGPTVGRWRQAASAGCGRHLQARMAPSPPPVDAATRPSGHPMRQAPSSPRPRRHTGAPPRRRPPLAGSSRRAAARRPATDGLRGPRVAAPDRPAVGRQVHVIGGQAARGDVGVSGHHFFPIRWQPRPDLYRPRRRARAVASRPAGRGTETTDEAAIP